MTGITESDIKIMIMGIINARIPKEKINSELYEIQEDPNNNEDEDPKYVFFLKFTQNRI